MSTGLLSFQPVNTFSQQDVNNDQNAYGASQNAYQGAQNNQADFTKNMQSGSDMYAQNQGAGNAWAGYSPAGMQSALKTVQQTQNVIGGLPQSINAQSSGYGATAGNLAGQYSGMMNNLNPALAAQTNQVAQQQATQGAAANYAQGATTAGIQTQQQKLGALDALTKNTLSQMDQARQVMQNMQTLYQQQGQFNSDEQQKYELANAAYTSAQATMRNLDAQAQLYNAQTVHQQQQNSTFAAPTQASTLTAGGFSPQDQASIRNYQSQPVAPDFWGGIYNASAGILAGMPKASPRPVAPDFWGGIYNAAAARAAGMPIALPRIKSPW